MTRRPRIDEESVLTRWMGMEMARINDGVVSGRKTLAALLAEENPQGMTRGGREYHFSRVTLSSLAEGLPGEIRRVLRLPILFFIDVEVRDSCYLRDETALRALQALGDLGEGRRLTAGRVWVALAIAHDIARRYPTAIQFVLT